MTVKELIDKLNKYPPETPINVEIEGGWYDILPSIFIDKDDNDDSNQEFVVLTTDYSDE